MPPSLSDFSALLLRLYGMAGDRTPDEFQDASLALLKSVLAFDSAMWGTGVQTQAGFEMQTVHLHQQPLAMLDSYQSIRHLDTAAAELTRNPRAVRGFHAPSWFRQPEQAPLREHGRRFEQANFFISAEGDPESGQFQWVTLFRADERAHCLDRECDALALLSPHLMQALALNRQLHRGLAGAEGESLVGRAICSLRGLYCQRDAVFDALLRTEWDTAPSMALPTAVVAALLGGASPYVGRVVVINGQVEQGLLFLRIRARCAVDALGERERLVADLLGRGLTHKEIARELGSAPATVRNQVQAIYRKLGVRHVAGLIAQLRLAE